MSRTRDIVMGAAIGGALVGMIAWASLAVAQDEGRPRERPSGRPNFQGPQRPGNDRGRRMGMALQRLEAKLDRITGGHQGPRPGRIRPNSGDGGPQSTVRPGPEGERGRRPSIQGDVSREMRMLMGMVGRMDKKIDRIGRVLRVPIDEDGPNREPDRRRPRPRGRERR